MLQIFIVRSGDNGGWPEQEGTLCNAAVVANCSTALVKPYAAPLYEVCTLHYFEQLSDRIQDCEVADA
jgi:hypothetical protein